MPEYKFYTIGRSGHISKPPIVADCQDDMTAIQEARQHLDHQDIEIWQGRRIVAYLAPESFDDKKT